MLENKKWPSAKQYVAEDGPTFKNYRKLKGFQL